MDAANIALQQLGGNKFLVMTGSKNVFSANKGMTLSMHLSSNDLKAKYLQVTLTGMDTYTMVFSKLQKGELITVKEIEGVYCDMLKGIYEKETGQITSL